jgi:tetratricopeptide (TPR) repeat protein
MKSVKDFFGSMFGNAQTPEHAAKPPPTRRDTPAPVPREASQPENEEKPAAPMTRQQANELWFCCDEALAFNPRDANAWFGKARAYRSLAQPKMALRCYDEVLAIAPRHAKAWYNKALAEDVLGRGREAMTTYRKFLELASPQSAREIAHARQRVHVLESKRV